MADPNFKQPQQQHLEEGPHPSSRQRSRRPRLALAGNWKQLLVVAAVIVIGWLAYGYMHTRSELKRLSNPKTSSQDQTKDLVTRVGKLIELPAGETPTTATVSDASKLKNQEFFARAQNGDKVLIYSKSGRAVLYRPSTNKVIEYSKVNLNANQ